MGYVRAYRAGLTPPPRALDVTIPGLTLGQTVGGLVAWNAVPTGEQVARVDFAVDGVQRADVTTAPYTWGWDTSLEKKGRHVLTVRAVGIDGKIAMAAVVVESKTPQAPPPVVELPPLGDLTGIVPLTPILSGGPVARVELWIDGAVVQTADAAPWTLTWDTTTVAPGQHVLAIRAVGPRGRTAAAISLVNVVAAQ
jgi:hypothetical protein